MRRLIAAALLACAVGAAAGGEHRRLLAVELAVVAGDLRRLQEDRPGAREAAGLRARIAGSLAALPLLLRRAGAEARLAQPARDALRREDWRALRRHLAELQRRFPLAPDVLDADPSPARRAFGAALHAQACAACHDAPAGDVELPARDLFDEARRLPRAEFLARLIAGVRGDRSTAWQNPFSDAELGALAAFYLAGGRPH
ncbi:MAG: hypothetical protein N2688_05600 [Burkholderiaceae bacterium]|nr:hypothetical protein [Burkholderiaceae bacterium]